MRLPTSFLFVSNLNLTSVVVSHKDGNSPPSQPKNPPKFWPGILSPLVSLAPACGSMIFSLEVTPRMNSRYAKRDSLNDVTELMQKLDP